MKGSSRVDDSRVDLWVFQPVDIDVGGCGLDGQAGGNRDSEGDEGNTNDEDSRSGWRSDSNGTSDPRVERAELKHLSAPKTGMLGMFKARYGTDRTGVKAVRLELLQGFLRSSRGFTTEPRRRHQGVDSVVASIPVVGSVWESMKASWDRGTGTKRPEEIIVGSGGTAFDSAPSSSQYASSVSQSTISGFAMKISPSLAPLSSSYIRSSPSGDTNKLARAQRPRPALFHPHITLTRFLNDNYA